MRAVIISGGAIKDYDYIKAQINEEDTIICADSGYDHAVRMGVKADIVVGDFDSAVLIPKDAEVIKYPAKKDCTDTEIAMEHARRMGFDDFLIVAGTGSRMDHTLTNILMIKECLLRREHAEIIDEHNKIMITNSKLHLHEQIGAIVSLVPLTDCLGVTADNFEYPLCNAALQMGKGVGVSNVMTKDSACVSVREGIMLVIVAED